MPFPHTSPRRTEYPSISDSTAPAPATVPLSDNRCRFYRIFSYICFNRIAPATTDRAAARRPLSVFIEYISYICLSSHGKTVSVPNRKRTRYPFQRPEPTYERRKKSIQDKRGAEPVQRECGLPATHPLHDGEPLHHRQPLYGAALFLFANIWTLYFEGNLRRLSSGPAPRKTNLVMWILLSASVFAGLALVFLYPIVMQAPGTNFVSFFVLLIAARSVLTWKVNDALSKPGLARRIYKGLFQILFFVPCLAFAWIIDDEPVMWMTLVGYALTGFLLSYQSSTMASLSKYIANTRRDKLHDIFSYRVFSNMSLYAQIALSLGGTHVYLLRQLQHAGILVRHLRLHGCVDSRRIALFGTVHQTRQQTGMDTESQHLHRGSGHVDNRLP